MRPLNTTGRALLAGVAILLTGAATATVQADTSYTREGPLVPGPDDGNIAATTAQLLIQDHYRARPEYPNPLEFNDVVSSNFYHRYLITLDPQHLFFLQSDVEEFSEFETTLDDWTQEKNAGPGFDIYERFFQRMEQRTAFVRELLQTEAFVFEDTEPILLNRREAEFPKDLEEAKSLWRDRLRYEFLEEKLAVMKEREKAAEEAEKEGSEDTVATDADQPEKSVEEEVRETLDRRYARNLKYFAEWDSDDVIQLYLTTLGRVFDPHTDYMGRAALEDFAINMNLSLFGIGAQLRSVDGYCTIERLLPGGPAEKSNELREKERIVAVAQGDGESVDVVDMNLQKVVQLIRGPKGTEVRLTMIPPESETSTERRVVSLTRDEIPLDEQAAKAELIDTPHDDGAPSRIGIIDLPTFYAPMEIESRRGERSARFSTSENVELLLDKLKSEGMEGLILDLRRNGGGSLEEAIRLTGLFIERGPVVQVAGPDGKPDVRKDRDPSIAYDGPLVILTSRGSASASEIVAGALQDYGRALIVGDRSTHGKGTVQSLSRLAPYLIHVGMSEDPGALKTTVQKFYRANGESTQLRGITPDIVLPSVANVLEDIGEAGLDNPLEWDEIETARYVRLERVEPYLPRLRELSEHRVSLSTDFSYVRDDMDLAKERQSRKTVLLNEAKRVEELEEAEARAEARKAERSSRPPTEEVVYEITLKDVEKPGLPEPLTAEVPEDGEDSDEPLVDPTLDEAKRILLDYIDLLNGAAILTAGNSEAKGTEN